jgi:Xaa-Pro aminopeptidase
VTGGESGGARSGPRLPRPDFSFLADALRAVEADAFVHAGTAADCDLRYLAGRAADRRVAFGYARGTPRLVLSAGGARPRSFPGEIERVDSGTAPTARLATRLAADRDEGTVAVPRQLPHDAARYLQRAGFELTSTTAVADARTTKSDAEVDAVARAAGAAVAGLERARELLADATAVDGTLQSGGEQLTPSGLARSIDAAIALAGARPAGNTRVTAGPRPVAAESQSASERTPPEPDALASAAAPASAFSTDEPMAPAEPIPVGEPIRIEVAPRDPAGYHAVLERTVAVDGSGGWERRAHVACEAARRVGIDSATAGDPAAAVAEELLAELGAFGFDPGSAAGPPGSGVGLSRTESPSLAGAGELRPGMVLSVSPSLSDDAETSVGLADTIVIEADGARLLTDCSTGMGPR